MKAKMIFVVGALLLGVVSPALSAGAEEPMSQDTSDKGAEAKYFTPVALGVVKDKRTGLEWMRCSLGQDWSEKSKTCSGDIEKFNFQAAQNIAKKMNAVGGYGKRTNWRVPTVRELQSLRYCSNGFVSETKDLQDGGGSVRRGCVEGYTRPTVAQAVFPNMGSELGYWSSSPYAVNPPGAWIVGFGDGYIAFNFLENSGPVRLVR